MIEAALLTSPQPLKLEALVRLFGGMMKKSQVQEQLARLQMAWQSRGLRLVETAEGWRFQCVTEVAQALMRINGQKPPKYSRAVLETLAIIAYRQPATRGDIEEIRGVAVNANVMRQLEERGWIEVVGHRETPGRPSLFATTKQFLTDLGLKSLSELPPLAGTEPQYQEFELDLPDPRESIPAAGTAASTQTPQVGGNVLLSTRTESADAPGVFGSPNDPSEGRTGFGNASAEDVHAALDEKADAADSEAHPNAEPEAGAFENGADPDVVGRSESQEAPTDIQIPVPGHDGIDESKTGR